MLSRTAPALCLTLLSPLAPAPLALGQAPVADTFSLLDAMRFYPTDPGDPSLGGSLHLDRFVAGFIPREAYYTGAAGYDYPVKAYVRDAAGNDLVRFDLAAEMDEAVFSIIRPHGTLDRYRFESPGDYSLAIEFRDEPMTTVPFTITIKESGDPFAPARETYATGPWADLGVIVLPQAGNAEEFPKIRSWARGGVFSENRVDKLEFEVRESGDVVFVGSETSISNSTSESDWTRRETGFKFRKGDGGGPAKLKDITKKDGDYLIVRKRNGEPEAGFEFQVRDGKLVPHPRSAFDHQPVTDQLLSRSTFGDRQLSDLIWMERLSPERLNELLGVGPAVATGPSPDDLARWTPGVLGGGPAEVVLTDADCRMDGTLSVGDGVIAFATGGGNGVGYLVVGEDSARSLPDGQSFSGRQFCVTGKKIVLAKRNQVHVFDTQTGSMTAIPETEVYLLKTFGEMWGANILAGDGKLCAVLNDPKKVDDRVMLKVIDTSGPEPRWIAMDNVDVDAKDITSVAVDAETGLVGMLSNRRQKIWVGPVAEGARLAEFDFSGYDGFGQKCQLALAGGRAFGFDATGSPKLRSVEIGSGDLFSFGSIGMGETCYDLGSKHYAVATDTSRGSAYAIRFGAYGEEGSTPGNTGESGAGSGNFGMGSSLALTADGSVFLAGRGKGGIGADEFLQVSTGGDWRYVAGEDGEPLPAVDLRSGRGLIAFKTGNRNDTKIAYLLTGDALDSTGLRFWQP